MSFKMGNVKFSAALLRIIHCSLFCDFMNLFCAQIKGSWLSSSIYGLVCVWHKQASAAMCWQIIEAMN